MYGSLGKRIFDFFAAALTLIVASPFLVVISCLIKIVDPGPVLFKQYRVGRYGKQFLLYKFRSMPVNAPIVASDELDQVKFTRIGRFIRRTNIDELPQLFNILIGDMSIVGPRPPLPSQKELVEARRRNGALACRPGLTGLAQVSSFDGMSYLEKAEHDGKYAKNVTLLNDMLIILRTFAYLLKPPPVY